MNYALVPLEQEKRRRKFGGQENATRFDIIEPCGWQGQQVPLRRWLVSGLIPFGSVTLLTGDGGTGKSLLSQQLLTCCATGRSWLGLEIARCKAFGIFCEDETDELHRRQSRICQHYDCELGDLEDLQLASRVDTTNTLVSFQGWDHKPHITDLYGTIMHYVGEFGCQLLVLDSLHDLFLGNENSRPQARIFINLLRDIALKIDGAVLLTAHPSLSGMREGTGSSGSTAWNNAVRSRLYLRRPQEDKEPDANIRVLKTMKANYGGSGDEITLKWQDGVFVREEEPSGVFASIERAKAEREFLERLDRFTSQGRYVSDAPNSPRYAPKVFAGGAGQRKIKAYKAAMEGLFDQGKIEIGEVDRYPNRSARRGIRRTEISKEEQS